MKVVVHRRAARYLRRLPADQKKRIKDRLLILAEDPLNYPGLQQMQGRWAGYQRIRIGNLRMILTIDRDAATIFVDHVGPRSDVYK
jgi:mRNA interferase RelE/StbE